MRHYSFITIFFFTAFCNLNATADTTERIAIVAAYQGELDALLSIITPKKIEKEIVINGSTFYLGRAHGKAVIFFKTNVSTINAAMTTQLALSNFNIKTLLFSGVAGGINPALEKGDIAIPKKWYYHAEGAYYNPKEEKTEEVYIMPREFEYEYPYGNFGMFFPSFVRTTRGGMTEVIEKRYFAADADLLAKTKQVTENLQKGTETQLINAMGKPAKILIGGAGVAGPVFMDNAEYREFVYQTWKADSLDMESTAIGHVCWSNNVPFLIIRSLSDLAGGQHGENDFPEFAKKAERNAANILNAVLKSL